MFPGTGFPRGPNESSAPIEGVKEPRLRRGLEIDQLSRDCLVVRTKRGIAVVSAATKVLIMAGIYIVLIALLSGQRDLTTGIDIVRQMAQANTGLYVLLVLALVLVIPMLGDLRLILEGRRLTFDVAQNELRLNRRVLAVLSDLTQVRIRDEHVRGGPIHHLVIVFQNGRTFELDNSLEAVPLRDHAQRIADFLKVTLQLPDSMR
jgi:hypothetical protein